MYEINDSLPSKEGKGHMLRANSRHTLQADLKVVTKKRWNDRPYLPPPTRPHPPKPKYKRHPKIPAAIRDTRLWPSLSLVSSAPSPPLRIPTAPCGREGHIAFWETLRLKKKYIKSPVIMTRPPKPASQQSCRVPSDCSAASASPQITGALSSASSSTVTAAVCPLARF